MTDNEIIQEATEAVTKGMPCAFLVPPLLEVVKSQKLEIEILIRKKEALRDEIERWKEQNVRLDKECDHYIRFASAAKSEAYREFNARLYAYKTNIFIKGEELMIIPMSDYDEILKELTESNE